MSTDLSDVDWTTAGSSLWANETAPRASLAQILTWPKSGSSEQTANAVWAEEKL